MDVINENLKGACAIGRECIRLSPPRRGPEAAEAVRKNYGHAWVLEPRHSDVIVTGL